MAVVAVYSLKGGVGKTSFAVNLAWSSAIESGRQTLLWDLDPQWAASYMLGHEPQARDNAHKLFAKNLDPSDQLLATGMDGLDLLPADRSLRALDQTFFALGKKKRLAGLIGALEKGYERIILDCPPGLTETTDQMMRVADVILVPIIPSPLSQRAFEEVATHLNAKHGGHVPILPVFSMVDRRRTLHLEALKANPKWPVIPMASAVEQMAVHRAPIGAFARSSPAAAAFAELWAGVERKVRKMDKKN
jgi:chromosome partitioning protein